MDIKKTPCKWFIHADGYFDADFANYMVSWCCCWMEHWNVTKIWVYQTFTFSIEFSILNVSFLSPARLCWQLWGTSLKFMKLQQYIRKTTTSKEKLGKFQQRSTQTSQFWGSLQKRFEGVYKRDCKIQDKKQRRDSCEKDFPAHAKLTPGLYLLTCGCPQKSVYGFSMMISGESPSLLFDLVMTRFEANYNPHLIYDASCLAKEYGYNRELKRFMQLTITTDWFHECNHSTCSDAFRSSQYISLVNVNTEEWTNQSASEKSSTFNNIYVAWVVHVFTHIAFSGLEPLYV